MVDKVLFSHKVTEWQTPKELYEQLNQNFSFDLDPCTTKDNPLNTPIFYTKEENGLSRIWFGNVFVNPPYNEIEKWLKKAVEEIQNNPKINNIVFLLPVRSDTKWFHEYIYNKPKTQLHFLKGRLKFTGAKNSAPFPSMIVTFSKKQ